MGCCLAPQSGQHGNDLLFPAHDPGEKQGVVLGLGGEGVADGLVAAHIQQLRALQQHVGEHQDHHIVVVLLLEAAHHRQELLLALQHLHGVQAGDLAHAQVLLADVKLLEVAAHQLLHGFASGGGEQLAAQLLYVDAADAGHALGHGDIPLGAGGGLEHDGVGQNGRRHHAGHALGGHEPPVLVHSGQDGIGRAHGLIAHIDGVGGLDVRQAVVVDDLQDPFHSVLDFVRAEFF